VVFVSLLLVQALIASLGAALLLSALTVTYRDFRYVIPTFIQVLMFVSPVVYPVTLVPEPYQWMVAVNPMVGVIDGFRSAVLGKPWNGLPLAISAATGAMLFAVGLIYFRRTERRLADIA
jgi:lipopolysaccharide transport system permease protein